MSYPRPSPEYGFVGATCPGFDEDKVDWRGCNLDPRLVGVYLYHTEEFYSDVWKEAMASTSTSLTEEQ